MSATELVFATAKNNAATDSLRIAAGFGKTHGNVLQAIDRLECDADFRGLNFHSTTYTDRQKRKRRFVVMTRAGFVFLVTGFTGKRAAAFKQDYIERFDRMEAELARARSPLGQIDLASHTKREVQVGNSKAINHRMVEQGGGLAAASYNQENCRLHTGKRPSQLKEEARLRGVPSKVRASAKELLRHERPGVASAMSLCDELVMGGTALPDAAAVTRQAIPVFEGLLRLGFTTKQLSQ